MTQEEKAKAYDEALKIAQCWLNSPQTIEDCGYTVEDAIQNIFPVLKESEDERIRKWLVQYIKDTHPIANYWNGAPTISDVLAWLEKQKEEEGYDAIPVESTLEYKLGFKAGKESEKQKTSVSNDLDKEIDRFFDECIEAHDAKIYGVDERVITVECYELTARHFAQWAEKQKEQKPAEWDELQAEFRSINEAFEDGKKEVIANPEKYGLCKPAEWSEEDKKMLLPITDAFRKGAVSTIGQEQWLKTLPERFSLQSKQEWSEEDEKMLYETLAYLRVREENGDFHANIMHNWLKSLPERFNLQPKEEWSKEETKDLVHILKVLDDCYAYGRHDLSKTDHDNLTNRIKFLRPSWKPSEEQIGALDYAYCELFKRGDVGHNILGPLQKLCDELRNFKV